MRDPKLIPGFGHRPPPLPEVVEEGVIVRVVSVNKDGLPSEEKFTVVILNLDKEVEVARSGDPISKIVGLGQGESVDVGKIRFTVERIIGRLN